MGSGEGWADGPFPVQEPGPKWKDDAESSSSLAASQVVDVTSPGVVCSELFHSRLEVDDTLVTSAGRQGPAGVPRYDNN